MNYKSMKDNQIKNIVNNIINNSNEKWAYFEDTNSYFYTNDSETKGIIYIHQMVLENTTLSYDIVIDVKNSDPKELRKIGITPNTYKQYLLLSCYEIELSKTDIKKVHNNVDNSKDNSFVI